MTFNLNKNQEPTGSTQKKGFDLTKNDRQAEVPKPNRWPYVLIGLAAVGGLTWYTIGREPANDSIANTVKTTSPAETVKTALPVSTVTPESGDIAPDAPILAASFLAGSSQPDEVAQETMNALKRDTTKKIYVFGYASSEGSIAVNQTISQARADAYQAILVKNGIAAQRIIAQGKGIDNPIASNDTETGRAKNRRVEVLFQ